MDGSAHWLKTTYPGASAVEVDFGSLGEWMTWRSAHPQIGSTDHILRVVQHARQHGITEPLSRRFFGPELITWTETSIREGGIVRGLNSRLRGTLFAIHSCLGQPNFHQWKIYAPEAVTAFALLLRGMFPKFLGSEYTSDPAVAKVLFPIPNEDLTRLSFASAAFDLVTSNEVLEHVPFLDTAIGEIYRILKPGGWHIGTCPFRFMDQESQVRTRLVDGKLVHVLEPEWHGDPMGTDGSLVFEIPGWDILDRAKSIGFSRAFWKFVQSPTFGIAAEHSGGVFVLCLQK